MKHFEINNDDTENLKDAFNRRISRVFVPTEKDLEELNQRVIESEIHNREMLMISNIDEFQHNSENWEFSEIPKEASFIALDLLLTELMGESDLERRELSFTLAQSIEALQKHAFVQCTELNLSNITECLNNGGDIIAYFSEELWRSCFGGEGITDEISGMRAIRITDVSDGVITFDDYTREDGRGIKIDSETFEWLSENGIMLEVYK